MIFSPQSVTLVLSSLLISFSANAAPLCEYAAFSVPALHHNILGALSERGFAVAPAAYFSDSQPDSESLDSEFWVLADGHLFAMLSFQQNAVDASSEIRITGPDGIPLAESKSTLTPCAGGLCRDTSLITVLDRASGSVNGSAGLHISQRPSYGMKYFVYGEAVGSTSWRSQFNDRYEWILNVLTDKSRSTLLYPFTDMQRLMFAMASKPALTAFLNVIDIEVARDGHFIVRGRVTHAAYNAIIDAALDSGFYNIEPQLVIDSAAGEYRYHDRPLAHCLGRDYH